MTRAIRFGVLGCADIAWRRTLPALAADPGIQVAAIASRDLDKARRFTERFGGESVLGYGELLKRADIDAVYIPLPALLHAEWIEKALLAGKHVLAEKPLTADRKQTESLVQLAADRELVLLENFMFLHHSQHARVAAELAAGTIGTIRTLSARFTIPPKPPSDIRYRADVGGGALLDIGVYPIRTALHYLGPTVEVLGASVRVDRKRGVTVSGSALLGTADGVTAHLVFGMEHSYCSSYEIHGSDGRLSLDRAFTPPPGYQPTLRIDRQDHLEVLTLPADDQFANIIRLFCRATLGEKDNRRWTEDSLHQAALVEAVCKAAVHAHV